jgi:uncharacterized protein
MTPQERDLVTALLDRLKQQGNQPKDPEADALIRRAMAEQPDAPYYLVQTVLIQDMALRNAESRIAELERQLAQAKAAPAPQSQSFLGSAGRGSVPASGAWTRSTQGAPPETAWSQSGGAAAAGGPAAGASAPAAAPSIMPGAGSGFLRQAATTAAGIAGGALLFQGIQSLLGPHYGGGLLSGMPAQPGISETVNNYYGDQSAPGLTQADAGSDQDQNHAADQDMADADFADQDFGNDDSTFDV